MPRHYHASPYHRSRSAVDGSLSFLGSVLSITWHEIVQPRLAQHNRLDDGYSMPYSQGASGPGFGHGPGSRVAVLCRVPW